MVFVMLWWLFCRTTIGLILFIYPSMTHTVSVTPILDSSGEAAGIKTRHQCSFPYTAICNLMEFLFNPDLYDIQEHAVWRFASENRRNSALSAWIWRLFPWWPCLLMGKGCILWHEPRTDRHIGSAQSEGQLRPGLLWGLWFYKAQNKKNKTDGRGFSICLDSPPPHSFSQKDALYGAAACWRAASVCSADFNCLSVAVKVSVKYTAVKRAAGQSPVHPGRRRWAKKKKWV